jgi:hypothetical protein
MVPALVVEDEKLNRFAVLPQQKWIDHQQPIVRSCGPQVLEMAIEAQSHAFAMHLPSGQLQVARLGKPHGFLGPDSFPRE